MLLFLSFTPESLGSPPSCVPKEQKAPLLFLLSMLLFRRNKRFYAHRRPLVPSEQELKPRAAPPTSLREAEAKEQLAILVVPLEQLAWDIGTRA